MKIRPSEWELLDIVLQVFREEFLPNISEDKRYSGLMVENALSIVIRQIKNKTENENQELSTLASFLDTEGSLMSLNRLLSERIRSGYYSKSLDNSEKLRKILFEITKSSVSESNPKYLQL